MTDGAAVGPAAVRYETEVVQVGPMAEEFVKNGLMILFGDAAPAELHDICVLHHPTIVRQAPEPGDVVQIGPDRFTITAVGPVAKTNLLQLGHISLKADGSAVAALPGDISIEARPLPVPERGCVIRFAAADTLASPLRTPDRTKELP